MKQKVMPLAFVLLLLRISFPANAQEWMNLSLDYGPFNTGFRYAETLDPGRPCISCTNKGNGFAAREMEIAIWYPTEDQETGTMPYIQYLRLGAAGTITDLNILKQTFFNSIAGLGGDTSLFESAFAPLFHDATRARKDRTMAKGSWPLILYPDQPHFQNILCEFLASHGYIVASTRIKGTHRAEPEYNPAGIETGTDDLAFTLGYMRSHFQVKQEFAFIGTGFNASLGLNLASKNKDLAALVSLEGGITTPFEAGLISRSPYYELHRFTVPMLVIHAPHPDVKPELTYRYKYSERVYQSYPQSSEFYFLNFGLWGKKLRNIFPKANRTNPWESFEISAKSVLLYLNWNLKKDGKSKAEMLKNDWPPELVQTSVRPAVSIPPDLKRLTEVWEIQGVDSLGMIYRNLRVYDDQPFVFGTFYQLSQKMIDQTKFSDLLSWALLFADAYPGSAIPYTLQGRAHLELRNKAEARKNYEKALSLLGQDPELSEEEKNYFEQAIENRIKSLN